MSIKNKINFFLFVLDIPRFHFSESVGDTQFRSNRLLLNIEKLLNTGRWRFKFLEIFCIHHKQKTVDKLEIRHYTSTDKQTNLTTDIT